MKSELQAAAVVHGAFITLEQIQNVSDCPADLMPEPGALCAWGGCMVPKAPIVGYRFDRKWFFRWLPVCAACAVEP